MPRKGTVPPKRAPPAVAYAPTPSRLLSYFPPRGCDCSRTDVSPAILGVIAAADVRVCTDLHPRPPKPGAPTYTPVDLTDKFAGWLPVSTAVHAALCYRATPRLRLDDAPATLCATLLERGKAEVRVLVRAAVDGAPGIQIGVCIRMGQDVLEVRFYEPDLK